MTTIVLHDARTGAEIYVAGLSAEALARLLAEARRRGLTAQLASGPRRAA